jgi:preprotein translocase subunit YajC
MDSILAPLLAILAIVVPLGMAYFILFRRKNAARKSRNACL